MVNRRSPFLTSCPSAKCTPTSAPPTWDLTDTDWMASTAPTPRHSSGTSSRVTVSTTTGSPAAGPGFAAVLPQPGSRTSSARATAEYGWTVLMAFLGRRGRLGGGGVYG